MEFKLAKTSTWLDNESTKPYENAFMVKTMENGYEKIEWHVNVETLNDLLSLVKETGNALIICPEYFGHNEPIKKELELEIEIYDRWRE